MKTDDKVSQETIRHLKKCGDARRAGKLVSLRHNWDAYKETAMLEVVRAKFVQNPDLAQKLLDTEDAELVEGNTWHDNFFGNCSCPRCKNVEGKNVLGKLLMFVRKEIKKKSLGETK